MRRFAMGDRALDDLEMRTRKQIREIQERYQREVAPLVEILVSIENMRPPAPIFIDMMALSEEQQKSWMDRIKSLGVPTDEAE
jgi:hypothetical protein